MSEGWRRVASGLLTVLLGGEGVLSLVNVGTALLAYRSAGDPEPPHWAFFWLAVGCFVGLLALPVLGVAFLAWVPQAAKRGCALAVAWGLLLPAAFVVFVASNGAFVPDESQPLIGGPFFVLFLFSKCDPEQRLLRESAARLAGLSQVLVLVACALSVLLVRGASREECAPRA